MVGLQNPYSLIQCCPLRWFSLYISLSLWHIPLTCVMLACAFSDPLPFLQIVDTAKLHDFSAYTGYKLYGSWYIDPLNFGTWVLICMGNYGIKHHV